MGRHKGYIMSEEQKAKIRLSRLGMKFTEAHRRHISESATRRIGKSLEGRIAQMVHAKALKTLTKYAVVYGVDSRQYIERERFYMDKGYLKPNYDRSAVKAIAEGESKETAQRMEEELQNKREQELGKLYRIAYRYGTGSREYGIAERRCIDSGCIDGKLDAQMAFEKGEELTLEDERRAMAVYDRLLDDGGFGRKVSLTPLSKMSPERKRKIFDWLRKNW